MTQAKNYEFESQVTIPGLLRGAEVELVSRRRHFILDDLIDDERPIFAFAEFLCSGEFRETLGTHDVEQLVLDF